MSDLTWSYVLNAKKGHLYPVVTANPSAESKGQARKTDGIRDYECAICGYKQKLAEQKQDVDRMEKKHVKVTKSKKARAKTKAKIKRKRTK